jgi:hypothetical protein
MYREKGYTKGVPRGVATPSLKSGAPKGLGFGPLLDGTREVLPMLTQTWSLRFWMIPASPSASLGTKRPGL